MYSGLDNGNHKGGGGGTGGSLCSESELFGVIGDEGPNQKDAQDVEDDDTPEGQLDGAGDYSAGVLGFADGHADKFGSEIGESGSNKGRP